MAESEGAGLKAIFGEALERCGAEREAYLDGACAGDAALRARVEALLAAAEKDDAFLSGATVGEPPGATDGFARDGAGRRIGPYRVLQLIGEGGFGSVYMAEQERPVRRRVALKVIKLGMDTRAVVARFEQERQALALMDHPNIAKVLDAGTTENGRPFFVMELVKGEPITEFCDRNNFTIAERLGLFTQVCRAVQHAHTKGIIHRDIKPTNVLVSTHDGRPLARVIDFGIAKAIDQRLTEKTVFTEFRQLVGTPEYMSPEQAAGSLDIDTRTDVYSLGVMLYELLTGSTPFDAKMLRSAAYGELQRIIREDDPPRPSARLSESADTLPRVAANRRIEPRRLGTLVRGELDWIVMRALEKDRGRRYDTPSALAAEVQRSLTGDEVLAAPPSRVYRVRKFARRHQGAVIAGALISAALLAGTGVAGAGYITATRARDAEVAERENADRARESAEASAREAKEQTVLAVRQGARARGVNDFFQQLLEGVSPARAGANRDVTVRELVDRSAKGLDEGRLSNDPETRATILGTIGGLYWNLGALAEAKRYLERAIELAEKAALPGVDVAILRDHLGHVLRDRGDIDGAERSYRQALVDATRDGPGRSAVAGSVYNSLAGIAMSRDRLAEADDLYAKALDNLKDAAGDDRRQLLEIQLNVGVLANRRGDAAAAERSFRLLLESARGTLGEDDPLIVDASTNLAVLLGNQKRFDESLPLLERALATARRIYGDTHPATLNVRTQMAGLSLFSRDWARAEKMYAEVVAIRRQLPEDARAEIYENLRGYAAAVEYQGRPAEAESARREMLEVARARRPKTEVATCLSNLGRNLLAQERYADAEPVLAESVALRSELIAPDGPQGWLIASTKSMLGEAVLGRAEAIAETDGAGARLLFAQAEGLLVPAAESLPGDGRVVAGPVGTPDRKREPIARTLRLYTSWLKLGEDAQIAAKAASWKRRLDAHDAGK